MGVAMHQPWIEGALMRSAHLWFHDWHLIFHVFVHWQAQVLRITCHSRSVLLYFCQGSNSDKVTFSWHLLTHPVQRKLSGRELTTHYETESRSSQPTCTLMCRIIGSLRFYLLISWYRNNPLSSANKMLNSKTRLKLIRFGIWLLRVSKSPVHLLIEKLTDRYRWTKPIALPHSVHVGS